LQATAVSKNAQRAAPIIFHIHGSSGFDAFQGRTKLSCNRNVCVPLRPKFRINNAIAANLTRVEHARGFLDAAKLSEDWIAGMQQRALVLEAHHTTHIEGTHLTLEQSERLLAGEKPSGVKADDAKEVTNYRKAVDLVADYLGSGDPVTEGLIREIHKRLVRGVRGNAAAPGEYPRIQNYVANSITKEIIYTPPSPLDLPPMMAEFVSWLNSEQDAHPILVAGIAQFQLVHIHPFLDGNGRTARLLSMLCLYRKSYDFKRLFTLSEYYDRDRPRYYEAIQSVRRQNLDLTEWLEYFTLGLHWQLAEVQGKGEALIRLDVLAKKHKLSSRQRGALELALQQTTFRIQDFEARCPGVHRRSLQRDLAGLLQKDLLQGRGRDEPRRLPGIEQPLKLATNSRQNLRHGSFENRPGSRNII
jgi:Fic family protein